MDRITLIKEFAACTSCFSGLNYSGESMVCPSCGNKYTVYLDDILSTVGDVAEDIDFSMEKWKEYYHEESARKESERIYREDTLPRVMNQLLEYMPDKKDKNGVFLEIGCGQSLVGEEMAKRGWFFIGVDYSLFILKSVKKRFEEMGIENYLLLHGDITALPLKNDSVDFIYGGGVIEHFKNNQIVVNHLHRALKPGGASFNSVPFINIGNMVYRSIWGSIPNLPVIRQIAEFVNLKLLKGRHMRFGYELQFSERQLRKIHKKAGFKPDNIKVERFDYTITLEIVKNDFLRNFFTHLIKNNRNFWQMVKVIGIKK